MWCDFMPQKGGNIIKALLRPAPWLLKYAKLVLRGLLITVIKLNKQPRHVIVGDELRRSPGRVTVNNVSAARAEKHQLVPARFLLSLRAQSAELGPRRFVRSWPVRRVVHGHKLTSKTWHCHHSESWPTYLTLSRSVRLTGWRLVSIISARLCGPHAGSIHWLGDFSKCSFVRGCVTYWL